jgi:hypothetical protein
MKQKILKITEAQYNAFINGVDALNEGVDWSKNDDGSINFSINQNKDNNSNKGKNSVDTRVFGTKDDILRGKILTKNGTESGNSKSLEQSYTSKQAAIKFYQNVIQFIQNGRKGIIEQVPGLDTVTWNSVKKWFDRGDSDNRIIDACKKSMNRISSDATQTFSTYNRVSQSPNNDKVARYLTGIVPYTNVRYISLFSMTDFNFSDAIKHGTIRQNGNTDQILGIGEKDRQVDANGNLATIDITYDGKIKPNIAQNFSLNNVQNGHYKQQFGLNGSGGYSSVSQFLDKSVNYAAYALKQENFSPDVLVSAPSSSKFNYYYCTNLSNKLGIPYISDFFKRNVINVKYADGQDLLSKGFSPKDVMEFESQAKNIAYNEIAYYVSEPIRNFLSRYETFFNNISLQKHSREKTSMKDVFDCTMIYAYRTIVNNLNNDVVSEHLCKTFLSKQNKLYQKSYDSSHIFNEVSLRIRTKIGQKAFNQVLIQTKQLIEQYSDILKQRGYKLRFDTKRFKITAFKKQFRPFLSNIYIIADDYMNNGELLKRYRNAKFLIFDEDINSGATLKIVIDALEEKLTEQNSNNIMCLVNAYSASGF